jgi:hypothetical protein
MWACHILIWGVFNFSLLVLIGTYWFLVPPGFELGNPKNLYKLKPLDGKSHKKLNNIGNATKNLKKSHCTVWHAPFLKKAVMSAFAIVTKLEGRKYSNFILIFVMCQKELTFISLIEYHYYPAASSQHGINIRPSCWRSSGVCLQSQFRCTCLPRVNLKYKNPKTSHFDFYGFSIC